MLKEIVELPRTYKRTIMLLADAVAIPVVYWLSFNLRVDFTHLSFSLSEAGALAVTSLLTIYYFARTGLYRAVVRYMGMDAALAVTRGALVSTVILTVVCFLFGHSVPRSVPFIYFMMLMMVVGGGRFFIRHMLFQFTGGARRNVAIYGAGSAGAQVLMALNSSPEYRPVLFIDDDPNLQGRILHGVPVVGRHELAHRIESLNIVDLLLAMPSATHSRRKQLLDEISAYPVHVKTIPGISDLVTGQARIEEIREIDIEDLLGRDAVAPDQELLHANVQGKVVMVTGAGGSIGSELCRQMVALEPAGLVLFEQSEYALYQIERELEQWTQGHGIEVPIYPIIGSVLDKAHLQVVIQSLAIQTIYHAAAYKHVPLVEYNVVSGIRNYVIGTLRVAEAARTCGVETCVLISTDKAVRPANVMGASKRLAELVLQAMQGRNTRTRFSMVRFGNVLGSSGSVIPLFREQIAKGGPVTVTHPDIIRYFMTIPEAAQLVIQAGAMADGGDVFVLDMGEPVRIANVARKMISLMGYSVKTEIQDGDIEIVYSGLRPGEKLYEELLIGDNVTATRHPRVKRAIEFSMGWADLMVLLNELERYCDQGDSQAIRELLLNSPIDFNPSSRLEDIVWNHRLEEPEEIEQIMPITNLTEVVALKKRKEMVS